jgi:hypothetical protein
MLPGSGDRMEPACRRRSGSLGGLARGARRVSSRAAARTPRGCISRDTPLRRVACLIGPKCQDEGVMISISPETGAALPGAMGSLPIAEALKGVTAEQGASRLSSHEIRSHGPRDFSGQITDWPLVSLLQSPFSVTFSRLLEHPDPKRNASGVDKLGRFLKVHPRVDRAT